MQLSLLVLFGYPLVDCISQENIKKILESDGYALTTNLKLQDGCDGEIIEIDFFKTCAENSLSDLEEKHFGMNANAEDKCEMQQNLGASFDVNAAYDGKLENELFTSASVSAADPTQRDSTNLCQPSADAINKVIEFNAAVIDHLGSEMNYKFCDKLQTYLATVKEKISQLPVMASSLLESKSVKPHQVSAGSFLTRLQDRTPFKMRDDHGAWKAQLHAALETPQAHPSAKLLKAEAHQRGYDDLDPECASIKAYLDDQQTALDAQNEYVQTNLNDCSAAAGQKQNLTDFETQAWALAATAIETANAADDESKKDAIRKIIDADAISLDAVGYDLRNEDCEMENSATSNFVSAFSTMNAKVTAEMGKEVDMCAGPVGAVYKLTCAEGEPNSVFSNCNKNYPTEGQYRCLCNTGYVDQDPTNGDYKLTGISCLPESCMDFANSEGFKDGAATVEYVADEVHAELGVAGNTYMGKAKITCSPGYHNNGASTLLSCDWDSSGGQTQWHPMPSQVQCVDIEECNDRAVYCTQSFAAHEEFADLTKCENTVGSYTCSCNHTGFYVDMETGNTCLDKDECPELCPSSENFNCTNTPGSYECLCQIGFQMVAGECMDRCLSACPEAMVAVNGEQVNSVSCTKDPVNGDPTCGCADGFSADENGGCVADPSSFIEEGHSSRKGKNQNVLDTDDHTMHLTK